MKRKTSTIPTKIYTYGSLPPTEGTVEYEKQVERAHRYRNTLAEIEHRRRAGIAEVQRQHDAIGPLLEVIESLETQIGEARVEARLLQTGSDRKKDDRLANKELIEAMQADLAIMRCLRSWTKAALKVDAETHELLKLDDYASMSWAHARLIKPWFYLAKAVYAVTQNHAGVRLECEYAMVDELAAAEKRDERSHSGLGSGTYLVVEKAADAWRKSPDAPRFERYDGEGRVAVQLQGGLSVAELLSGEDTRLRILQPAPMACPENPTSRRQIARAIAYSIVSFCRCGDMVRTVSKGRGRDSDADLRRISIRVGSDRRRRPIWATFPVLLHRPLPSDGKIMWAWILRTREGINYRYSLQITVEAPSFVPQTEPPRGIVAVDVGSRDLPTGEIRAAYWLADNGQRDEILLPLTRQSSPTSSGLKPDRTRRRKIVPDNLDKCESLRGIRDRNLDDMKHQLAVYKVAAGASTVSPQTNETLAWLKERLSRVTLWRSPARLAMLHHHWLRHPGDDVIYEALGAYLKQDRHLLSWETNERNRHLGRRKQQYRNFAAMLARNFSKIVLPARDYRREEWVPEVAPSSQAHESRTIMRKAAPGILAAEIKRAAKASGAEVVEVKVEGDTAWCLNYRICETLLAASGAVVNEGAEALAKGKRRDHYGTPENFKRRRLGTHKKKDSLADQDVTVQKKKKVG